MKKLFKGALSLIFAAATLAGCGDKNNGAEMTPDLVDKQIVTTVFVRSGESYQTEAGSFKWRQIGAGYDDAGAPRTGGFRRDTVSGKFKVSEAYSYKFAFVGSEDRKKNGLVTFTSPEDIILTSSNVTFYTTSGPIVGAVAGGGKLINLPADAVKRPLSAITREERHHLVKDYLYFNSFGNGYGDGCFRAAPSLAAGLADTTVYQQAGFDGYTFQVWNDVANGDVLARETKTTFTDITNLFNKEGKSSGKMLSEVIVSEEGRYIRLPAALPYYSDELNTNSKYAKAIDKMTPDELQDIKCHSHKLGIDLVDRTIHTFVRDAKGQVIAFDSTKTLYAKNTTNGLQDGDIYVLVDLKGGERDVSFAKVEFPKGSFAPGVLPEVKVTPTKNEEMPIYTIGGKRASVSPWYDDYEYLTDIARFKSHGKASHIPYSP